MVKGDEKVKERCWFMAAPVAWLYLISRVKCCFSFHVIPSQFQHISKEEILFFFCFPVSTGRSERFCYWASPLEPVWTIGAPSCSETFKRVGCQQSQDPETGPSSGPCLQPACCLFNGIYWQGRQQCAEFVMFPDQQQPCGMWHCHAI